MKNKSFPLLCIITIINFFGIILWSNTIKDWVINLNDEYIISRKDFNKEYESFIEYQKLKDLFFSEKEMENLRNDSYQKTLFLYNYVNEILIIKDAKDLKLFDEAIINKKVEQLKNILKRNLIKQIYINKTVKNKINISPNLIEKYYNEIANDPKNSKLSIKDKKKLAEKKAMLSGIEEKFVEILNDLKNKYQIKINDTLF